MIVKIVVICIAALVIVGFLLFNAFVSEQEFHIHDSLISKIALWVALIVLILALYIIGFTKDVHRFLIPTLAMGVGIVHVLLAPEHYSRVGFEQSVFFLGLGTYQLAFGLLFIKGSRQLSKMTIVIITASIFLYFITRFDVNVKSLIVTEGIDSIGIMTKTIEVLLIIGLAYHLKNIRKGITN